MKIPKSHDISGYQKSMHEMADQLYGHDDAIVSMCIKSKNLVEKKLEDLRCQRDNLNTLIGEYKAKAQFARYMMTEIMRANDWTEAGQGDHAVKRIKCGRPSIVELNSNSAYMIPTTYTKVTVEINKKMILDEIKDNGYVLSDKFKGAIELRWTDKLKFLGDK